MPKDYYKILGLEQNADKEEVKKAYRRLSKKYHPDINRAPGANDIFIELTEAYEMLVKKIDAAQGVDIHDFEREIKEEIRRKAAEHARMKYEKFVKEHEAFKVSGVYDIALLFKLLGRFLLILLTLFFYLIPIYLSFKETVLLFFGLFCWPMAIFLTLYILERKKDYFKVGKFYYNIGRIKEYFNRKTESPQYKCFYCKGHWADSKPYKIYLIKIKGVKTVDYGPLQRQVSYKRNYKNIKIPRSRKALRVHTLSSLLKISILIIAPFLLTFNSILWKIVFATFLALFASLLFNMVTQTRSKVGYMFNPFFILKSVVWLLLLFAMSDFSQGFMNVQLREMGRAVIGLMVFFDPVLELLLKLPGYEKMFRPLPSYYREMDKYFENKFQYYIDAPAWTIVYPFFKWIFG